MGEFGLYIDRPLPTDPPMLTRIRFSFIQIGLVLFWAIWLSLVSATNVFDGLRQLGILPEGFTLASYNFNLIVETVGAHGVPMAVAALLFAGVIVWQLLTSGLLWRAWRVMLRGAPGSATEVTQAFAVSLALWAAFLIATELTVSYETAGTHKATLIAQLVSLMVIRSRSRHHSALKAERSERSGIASG